MRMKKFIIAAGFGLLAAATMQPATASAQSSDVTEYRQALVRQADSGGQAGKVLQEFDHLSPQKQQKFVDYATDPDVLKATMDAQQKASAQGADARQSRNFSTKVAGGDVVVAGTTTRSDPEKAKNQSSAQEKAGAKAQASGTIYDVRMNSAFSQEIFGITVTKLQQEFYYQTQGGQVINTKNCIDSHVNYNAVVAISSHTSHGTWGANGQCTTIWTGNIVFKGFGIDMDKKQYLETNGVGLQSRYLVNV